MRQIETDYLVVGAGASGMAFVDALIAESDADVVMVDRRHRPGGHWVDAYPFVRLHQASACYGVNSRVLGYDRIDESGPNAGFYERATASEICDYYTRVLEEHMLPSGQVRFFGMCDYLGRDGDNDSDGHHFVSILTGETTTVKVRRKFVDATYVESSIPSKHTPGFEVDPDVRLVPPNDLVNLSEAATGYTVIGAGKTSMDTCSWLLDQGVAPDRIRWVRARDPWTLNRAFTQPLELVGSFLEFYSRLVEAAAEAESTAEMFARLEPHGVYARLDPEVEPDVFRGATLSAGELESLRRVSNVVRLGRVRRIGTDSVMLDDGSIPSDAGHVYVDCAAPGLNLAPLRPIFEPDRITVQFVTLGIAPWSAATLGFVEASRSDDEDKNRLCPPLTYSEVSDPPRGFYEGFRSAALRMAEPDLVAWNENSRLNPMRGANDRLDDPQVLASLTRFAQNLEPAMANLERILARTTVTA